MPSPIFKRFTVDGAGVFPLDMLRADQCWPARASDAAAISASLGANDPRRDVSRSITLETVAKYAPNRRGWLNLRWRVVD